MTTEKAFQKYFLKLSSPSVRIPGETSPGIPDTEVIRGVRTYRVELKLLKIGPSGNKKISSIFKKTQRPFYMKFLHSGGQGLFVLFKVDKGCKYHNEQAYGLLKMHKNIARNLEEYTYQDLLHLKKVYTEYNTLKEVIDANFPRVT